MLKMKKNILDCFGASRQTTSTPMSSIILEITKRAMIGLVVKINIVRGEYFLANNSRITFYIETNILYLISDIRFVIISLSISTRVFLLLYTFDTGFVFLFASIEVIMSEKR